MIINDPSFKKLRTYLLFNGRQNAVVIADSPERAKEMMTQHTSYVWADADDIEIFGNKEQIIVELL